MCGPPNAAFLACDEVRAAGCVVYMHFDDATAAVKRLYVRPAFRKMAVARLLLDALAGHAKARGHRRLVLDTDRTRMKPAYKLYRSLGFTECVPYEAVHYACPTFMELQF